MPTAIEWTDETWNPIRARNRDTGQVGHFCVHKSTGCANCPVEWLQARFRNPVRFAAQDAGKVELFLDEKVLHRPLGWRWPRRVFVCSMTDLFLDKHLDEWPAEVWANMALARHRQFQVLTKRPERMRALLSNEDFQSAIGAEDFHAAVMATRDAVARGVDLPPWQWPFRNVWLGVSIENDWHLDRLEEFHAVGSAVRFLSAEPLPGPINIEPWLRGPGRLDWAIASGESGPRAQPMHPD